MQKRIGWVLAATMALTGVSASYAPASAAMPVAPAVNTAFQSGGQIEQVQDRGERRWRRGDRGGRNFSRNRGGRDYGYSRYRGGRDYGYSRYRGGRDYNYRYRRNRGINPGLAFGLGLGIGSGFGYYGNSYYSQPRYYAPRYNTYRARGGWKEACAARYRSFDWGSGTYLGYDGRRHLCRL